MQETVKQRLILFIKHEHLSQKRFEECAGLSNGYINSLRNSPSAAKLKLILDAFPQINEHWIMTGEGEMIKDIDNNLLPSNAIPSVEVTEFEYIGENKNDGIFFIDTNGVMRLSVPHVPYAARAEFANFADNLEPHLEGWSREMYVVDKKVRGKYLSFDVLGDSMDNGTRDCLQSGDKILARELERDNWRSIRTNDHRFWVIVFESSVLVKEIIDENLEEGTITCHSLNKSPEYHDFVLRLDDVRQLYYVVRIKPKERGV